MTRPMDYLPQGYRIEGDVPEHRPRLDETKPVKRALMLEELHALDHAMHTHRCDEVERVEKALPVSDAEARLKMLEATQQQLFAELNAIKKHLGLKDG